MRIAVAGGSGFIGEPLVRRLVERAHEVLVLTRDPSKVHIGRAVRWDGKTQGDWTAPVASADAVINLAGENIGQGRWTPERKRRLIESRVDSTRALVAAVATGPPRKRVFLNASAIGFYGPRSDEVLDENAPQGEGFLAELAARWEEEARAAERFARFVVLRFGVVLAADGGALAKMLVPFKLGAGGRVGSGQQWMSWIAREDVLRMMEWALENEGARGIYNATAPQPVRNVEFTSALAHALHRPALIPAPAFALKIAFGEMAEEVLLSGQRVVPARAVTEGFSFSAPSLEPAIKLALVP